MTNTEAPARIAKVHVAEVKAAPSYGTDNWMTPDLTDNVTKIRMYSKHQHAVCTWAVMYVGPEGSCRRVFQGPIEPGPYAALIPEATCISATRVPGDAAPVDELAEGDIVVIRGVAFRIDDSRGRLGYDPRLVPLTA